MIDPSEVQQIIEGNSNTESISMQSVFKTIKKVILNIPVDDNDPFGEKVFKTVKFDTGQLERIMSNIENTDYDIVFPAVFIRFINVRYLVSQNRTSEGRCTMRVRYVLNRLNNQDDDVEMEPVTMFEKINAAIQDAKKTEVALSERCNLMYWDMPLSVGLTQAYWIDYEVYFRADEGFQYRDMIKRKIVHPAFTNWSDVPDSNKPNVENPKYNDQTEFYEFEKTEDNK